MVKKQWAFFGILTKVNYYSVFYPKTLPQSTMHDNTNEYAVANETETGFNTTRWKTHGKQKTGYKE